MRNLIKCSSIEELVWATQAPPWEAIKRLAKDQLTGSTSFFRKWGEVSPERQGGKPHINENRFYRLLDSKNPDVFLENLKTGLKVVETYKSLKNTSADDICALIDLIKKEDDLYNNECYEFHPLDINSEKADLIGKFIEGKSFS